MDKCNMLPYSTVGFIMKWLKQPMKVSTHSNFKAAPAATQVGIVNITEDFGCSTTTCRNLTRITTLMRVASAKAVR
jgi:hypothetical protein